MIHQQITNLEMLIWSPTLHPWRVLTLIVSEVNIRWSPAECRVLACEQK